MDTDTFVDVDKQIERMSEQRARLLLDYPWFGALALRLRMEPSNKIPSASIDGTTFSYNPAYVQELTDKQITGLMAKAVMHCALRHPYRRSGRDQKTWNEAAHLALYPILKDEGFELPDTFPHDERFRDKRAEAIYAILESEKPPGGGGSGNGEGEGDGGSQFVQDPKEPDPDQNDDDQDGDGNGGGDGNGDGDSSGAGQQPQPEEDEQMSESDWEIAVQQQTAICEKAGNMSMNAKRLLEKDKPSDTNWKEVLRRFIINNVPVDYTWNTPNRRFIGQGLYLPGNLKENVPKIAVAVDTSGSINGPLLNLFAAEISSIMHEAKPESVEVIYCDYKVLGVEEFRPEEGEDVELHPKGGGGTAFQPVFDYIEARDEDKPACLIYLTDLYGDDPKEPDYPVLWVTPESITNEGPFGETIRITEHVK